MNSFFVASFAWFCSPVLSGFVVFCFFQADAGAGGVGIYDMRFTSGWVQWGLASLREFF
jgi:hypothetical protein